MDSVKIGGRDRTALYIEGRFVLGNEKAFPNEKFIRGRAGRKDLKIVQSGGMTSTIQVRENTGHYGTATFATCKS